jgi:adenylate cyclase
MQRRLAAILMADVVGYSRLLAEDEEGTIRALSDLHDLTASAVARENGHILDTTGDSILSEFPNVLGSLSCALELRERVSSLNQGRPPSRSIALRIGLHQDDVSIGDGRAYGDGINIAARLQALAEPGGIMISGRVYEDVADKVPLHWIDEGEQRLKNIIRPVRVFRLASRAPGEVPIAGRTGLPQ